MTTELKLDGTLASCIADQAPKAFLALAESIITQAEPQHLAAYLLDKETVTELLLDKLRKDPHDTLAHLMLLPARNGKGTAARAARYAQVKRRPARRRQISRAQYMNMEQDALEFMKKHSPASRKEICTAANIPTQNAWRQIAEYLQGLPKIKMVGKKASARYVYKA